jgi:hypothetical protein
VVDLFRERWSIDDDGVLCEACGTPLDMPVGANYCWELAIATLGDRLRVQFGRLTLEWITDTEVLISDAHAHVEL